MKLQRQVTVRHPIGSSRDRRLFARITVYVTLWRVLGAALLILPPLTLIANAHTAPPMHENARALVKQYAFEAFPQWALVHHEEACPSTIEDLAGFAWPASPRDPWGTDLEMRCGNGIRGAYIRSAGEDLKFDTADDISSND